MKKKNITQINNICEKIFPLLIFLFCTGLKAPYPDARSINAKVNNFPLWKIEQIERDLGPFKQEGITQEMLNSTIANIKEHPIERVRCSFYRHRIINNVLYHENRKCMPELANNFVYHNIIQNLLTLFKIPDIDFILCLEDGLPLTNIKEKDYLNPNKELQSPILVRAKKLNSPSLILIPDRHSFYEFEKYKKEVSAGSLLFPWDKKKEIVFWRGSVEAEKMKNDDNYKFRDARNALCLQRLVYPDYINAYFISTGHWYLKNAEKALDPSIIGNYVSTTNHIQYKYLPVLNGRMCTYPGYQWRLLSNSVAFKQESDEIQWFYSGLKPYEHYVPISFMMEDIIEKINWAKENDELCHQISENATAFVKEHLMLEDLYVYFYHVFKEYAKLQKFNTQDLKHDINNNSEWKLAHKVANQTEKQFQNKRAKHKKGQINNHTN